MLKTKKILLTLILALFFVSTAVVIANPLDIFKFKNDNTLDIVQLTDTHIDSYSKSDTQRMLGNSTELLKDAINQVNNLNDVDLVVFSGDVMNHSDKNEFLKFIGITNTLRFKWLYAPGNHDVGILGGLSKKGILNVLNKSVPCFNEENLYYSYSPNSKFLVLFMDGIIDNELTSNGYFPKKELAWLDCQLKNNPDKKIIIVQHHPVVEPSKSESHNVRNADEYLETIDKYSNVIAVLSGHYHQTKITQRKNVLHISTPALIEYPNAFREIKITFLNNSTKFDIKFMETSLKNVQQTSKSRSKNYELKEGQAEDRNATITINN